MISIASVRSGPSQIAAAHIFIPVMLLKSRILAASYKQSGMQSETLFAELTGLTITMHRLGYRKMPERMYQNCLLRMQSEERGNWDGLDLIHTAPANTKNPFAEYGFDHSIMMRSASESVFEEFFDLEDTVELGSVYFNIRTYEIVGFIAEEKLEKEIDVDVIALSVDPHADRYWWITPYAYCNNNPIRVIDPDGRDIYEFDKQGNHIRTIENKEIDRFHIVDGEGNRVATSSDFAAGTVKGKVGEKSYNSLSELGNATMFATENAEAADQIFGFLANNTDVEWSLVNTESDNCLNFIGTNHSEGSTSVRTIVQYMGFPIERAVHSHPNDDNRVSYGDHRGAIFSERRDSNVQLYNYTKTYGYTRYNQNSPYVPQGGRIILPPIEIRFKR